MYRISSITADSQNMSSAVGIACLFLQRDLTFILIWETKKRWEKRRSALGATTLGKWKYEMSVIVFDSVMLRNMFPCLGCEPV